MRKITFAAAIFALLSGCSTIGGWFDRMGDGGNTGTRGDRVATRDAQYRDTFGTQYYRDADGNAYYVGVPYSDDHVWPPVWSNQAFPIQEMHSE